MMKLSREFYGIALICCFMLGSLYLVTLLAEFPYFARLSEIPWLLPIINLAGISIYVYHLYRSISSAGKMILRDHAGLAVTWFVAWIVVIAVLVVQNDRHTLEERVEDVVLMVCSSAA